PTGKFLLWSDMPGDHMRRWSAHDGVTTFRKPCNMSNGLTYDRQGRLLACEHASSQVTRTERDGRIVPIATHYRGKQLNSPNDIVCKRDGGIYFSDPPYGRAKFYGVERPQELSFQGVYRAGAIHVFDQTGVLCEVLETPERTANFAWGDDDYRSLFITASTSLYRLRVLTRGIPVFYAYRQARRIVMHRRIVLAALLAAALLVPFGASAQKPINDRFPIIVYGPRPLFGKPA